VLQDQELIVTELANRVGPVLSDGTALRDLIDFDRREVSMRVLADPELHRLEMKRIFARSWIGVAHESEIPEPGDFVLRHIGEDAVIVTRGADGAVSILLNVCAHRGMEVCWADEGNQSQFKCPYHGWVFDSAGRLLGAPFEQEMYGDWDKSGYGLRTARVEIRYGIVFGNFDESAPSLEEHLGDLAWYQDTMYSGVEWEALGPPSRQRLEANWKTMADQFAGDGYHGGTLHAALEELGMADNNGVVSNFVKVSFPGLGHVILAFTPNRTDETGHNELLEEDERNSFQDRMLATLVFPATNNFGGGASMKGPDGSDIRAALIGGIVPKGPGSLELWTSMLVSKDTPEAVRQMMRRINVIQSVGAAPDDAVATPSMQKVANGAIGSEQMLKYNAVRGYNKPEHWPGPGYVCGGFPRDDSHWHFWLRWFDLLTDQE
jgi:phenylpropionate dioxygenase-like ring-hydroxylating dioxygenase large terminal subunit